MKTKITLIILTLGLSLITQAQFIVPFASAPTIDGVIDIKDPWGDTWILQEMEYDWGTTHNMTSKFQIVHDGDFIYIAVSVQDSTPNSDTIAIPNSYERDCIETWFSFKSSNFDEGEFTDGDHVIICQRANVDGKFIDGFWSYDNLVASGDIKYGVVSDNNGYVIEMAFNINTLAEGSNFDGVNFRFEIKTSDNTTGEPGYRTQRRAWYTNLDVAGVGTWHLGSMTLEVKTLIPLNDYVDNNVSSLEIYPNPVSKILTFSSPKNVESVTIINLQGQVVYKSTGNVLKDEKYQINVSDLPCGVYLLKADSMVKRIVIQ